MLGSSHCMINPVHLTLPNATRLPNTPLPCRIMFTRSTCTNPAPAIAPLPASTPGVTPAAAHNEHSTPRRSGTGTRALPGTYHTPAQMGPAGCMCLMAQLRILLSHSHSRLKSDKCPRLDHGWSSGGRGSATRTRTSGGSISSRSSFSEQNVRSTGPNASHRPAIRHIRV